MALELADAYRGDPFIRTAIAPHAEYTATARQLERWARAAADSRQPIHVHCSETRSEHEECRQRHHTTPVGLFYRLGVFEVPVYLAHCVWVEEEDIEHIRAGGGAVLHNPCSNMKLASGFAPSPRKLEKGLKIALSTDGPAATTRRICGRKCALRVIHKGIAETRPPYLRRGALYGYAGRGAALANPTAARSPGASARTFMFRTALPAYSRYGHPQHHCVSGNSGYRAHVAGERFSMTAANSKSSIWKRSGGKRRSFRNVFPGTVCEFFPAWR
jgi:hypothetical protein